MTTYTVWKYPLDLNYPRQKLDLPHQCTIMKVDFQDEIMCLWVLLNKDWNADVFREHTFIIAGTGREIEIDGNTEYLVPVGSAWFDKYQIYHLLEIKEI